jgi:hypothetical protein
MEKLNIHSIFETMNLNISTPTWCQVKMPYPSSSPQPVEKLAADHWYQEPQTCQQKVNPQKQTLGSCLTRKIPNACNNNEIITTIHKEP